MSPVQLLAEALPLLALLALLVTACLDPAPAAEAGISVAAVALALGPGLFGHGALAAGDVGRTLGDLAPVVVFLATILVVSEACARAGLFAAASRLLRPQGGRVAVRLLTVSFLLAAAVTAVLSLDATVVLLTPVVVAAARGVGTSGRPAAYACLRMANSSSLLLPVSNLTNLLALPHLSLTFVGFAATTAPVVVVVLAVEYVALRLLFRADLARTPAPVRSAGVATPVPVVPAVVVVLMLAGFAITSPFGVEPCWVSGAAALALVVWGRGRMPLREALEAAHLPFAMFVLALGVVVAVISRGFLGDAVAGLVPGSTSFGSLLLIAVIATVLANVLTNLSATLLVVPLVAPLGDVAVLAALIGLNVGSGLTLTGSLANLLWRRGLTGPGVSDAEAASRRPGQFGLREFHRVSLLVTPVTVLAAVATLALVT